MAYKIVGECINCGTCKIECENDAISTVDGRCVIDPDKCTECVGNFESSKCIEACPLSCIEGDPDHVESREQLLEKWKKLHPGKTPACT